MFSKLRKSSNFIIVDL